MSELKICVGSSRWTSANRNRQKHIYLAGRAICGKGYQNGWADVYDAKIEEVTCDKCKRMYLKSV